MIQSEWAPKNADAALFIYDTGVIYDLHISHMPKSTMTPLSLSLFDMFKQKIGPWESEKIKVNVCIISKEGISWISEFHFIEFYLCWDYGMSVLKHTHVF